MKLNESVPTTDVVIDLLGGIGFTSFHLIDFYNVASTSSKVHTMVREIVVLRANRKNLICDFIAEYKTHSNNS